MTRLDLASEGRPSLSKSVGFRAVRPPMPANVEVSETKPARIVFRGAKGEVIAASGPWRTSGDWWQEDAWDQDEWDLAIDFGTISRERELRERRDDPFPATWRVSDFLRRPEGAGLCGDFTIEMTV